MVRCGNRGDRDKGKSFYRLPAIISHQGEKTLELSKRRQKEWLAKIWRADLKQEKYKYVRVCSDHFISGVPAKLYDIDNPDWAPTQKLVHTGSARGTMERYGRAHKRRMKATAMHG